jgi:hypothetical protein
MVEEGKCRCGCGQPTSIANRNRRDQGWIKGQPLAYVVGHSPRARGGPKTNPGERWCCRCRIVKSTDEFFRNGKTASGLQTVCKYCSRDIQRAWKIKNRGKERRYALKHMLQRNFGLTLNDYDALLERQLHSCAICRKPERISHCGVPRLMSVDHDHATGKVRGLLCNDCNRGIGMLKDDPVIVANALAYLRASGQA